MMVRASFYCFLILSHLVLLLSAEDEKGYIRNCPASFYCGKLGHLQFPFTSSNQPECGLSVIYGCEDSDSNADKEIQLEKEGRMLIVQKVNEYNTLLIYDDVLQRELDSSNCEAFQHNFSLPTSSLLSFHITNIASLFRCNVTLDIDAPEYFKSSCKDQDIYYPSQNELRSLTDIPSFFVGCSSIQLPLKLPSNFSDPFKWLSSTFVVEVRLSHECGKCHNSGGQCRLDKKGSFFCAKGNSMKVRVYTAVASVVGVGVLILTCFYFRTKLSSLHLLCNNKSRTHENIMAFLRNHELLAIRRYSYNEIKKMTISFKDKLGQGGYGGVYKGKLPGGCPVAVKILNESKGNGEEFINEIASISKTSHVNVVTLLGFCFEGSNRALVYEYMPNGSLEKFIYEKSPSRANYELTGETLNKIAVGVARGLDYLHRGCNTRILHFDIKPHNILLDEDFCPKISDFGLSKICPRNKSIVSMLGARGTAGYIAPEVFSRNFGVVSHKSDVYSYGMMILEMVGKRKYINIKTDCTSETYFPHCVLKHLELNEELAPQSIADEEDKERMQKMVIVGLWCIQTNPSNRPTMGGVVKMLEGSIESLQVPPKPFLVFSSQITNPSIS
ncbi:Receptor-like protein kinase [Quillaja saponaria]|uniref:Receptor-like protein kinase n=1 Tax=Quillaja saponaria TaxID=32244 RepID=A0AAD7L9M6_QUISA|nr:Receptor-like protein kinase [Quillaja saponaria]